MSKHIISFYASRIAQSDDINNYCSYISARRNTLGVFGPFVSTDVNLLVHKILLLYGTCDGIFPMRYRMRKR